MYLYLIKKEKRKKKCTCNSDRRNLLAILLYIYNLYLYKKWEFEWYCFHIDGGFVELFWFCYSVNTNENFDYFMDRERVWSLVILWEERERARRVRGLYYSVKNGWLDVIWYVNRLTNRTLITLLLLSICMVQSVEVYFLIFLSHTYSTTSKSQWSHGRWFYFVWFFLFFYFWLENKHNFS